MTEGIFFVCDLNFFPSNDPDKDITWHDLEISESLVTGLEVFFSGDFASRSLELF